MSIRGGPDIIEDGLVLHLDAAEPLCFRGEPTTNVVTSPFSASSGFARSGGSVTNNAAVNFDGNQTAAIIDSVNWLAKVSGYSSIVAGGTYTTTWILKKYDRYDVQLDWGGSHTGNKTTIYLNFNNGTVTNGNIEYLGNGWFRCWYTSTLNSGTTLYYPQLTTTAVGSKYYFGGLQVERKSYATPFVNGTRGSTVATGGGLLDLTNNGNDGTINRSASPTAVFYNGDNGGSFVFDGSNDYISTGKVLIPRNGEYHIEGWVYPNDTNTVKMFITQYNNVNDSGRFQCFLGNDGTIRMHDGGGSMTGSLQSYSANIWQYVCFQRNSSNECRTYLNSIPSSSDTRTSTLENTNTLIATRGSSQAGVWYNGKMSNIRIYNRALSEDEIRQNYNATKGRFGL